MFNDFWRDVLSVLGFLLTAAGLVYAIVQIRMTKSAARAAEEAAKKTLAESQLSFQRHAAATAHRFINEAKIHVDSKDWEKAAVRISDVADQAAQMIILDPEWRQFAEQLRRWAATFRRLASGELPELNATRWTTFTVRLQTKIDSCHGPFQGPALEVNNDTE